MWSWVESRRGEIESSGCPARALETRSESCGSFANGNVPWLRAVPAHGATSCSLPISKGDYIPDCPNRLIRVSLGGGWEATTSSVVGSRVLAVRRRAATPSRAARASCWGCADPSRGTRWRGWSVSASRGVSPAGWCGAGVPPRLPGGAEPVPPGCRAHCRAMPRSRGGSVPPYRRRDRHSSPIYFPTVPVRAVPSPGIFTRVVPERTRPPRRCEGDRPG